MAIETPKYTTIQKDGQFEIREYAGYITAYTDLSAEYDSALAQGFGILANYIFGRNRKHEHVAMTAPVTESVKSLPEKIAMTSPVFNQPTGNQTHRVSFMMPSKYTLESLPSPNNADINFRKIEPYKAAVLSFSGYLNSRTVHKKTEELLAWLAAKKLSPKSAVSSAQYNPPWIPGWFRRNEVLVEV